MRPVRGAPWTRLRGADARESGRRSLAISHRQPLLPHRQPVLKSAQRLWGCGGRVGGGWPGVGRGGNRSCAHAARRTPCRDGGRRRSRTFECKQKKFSASRNAGHCGPASYKRTRPHATPPTVRARSLCTHTSARQPPCRGGAWTVAHRRYRNSMNHSAPITALCSLHEPCITDVARAPPHGYQTPWPRPPRAPSVAKGLFTCRKCSQTRTSTSERRRTASETKQTNKRPTRHRTIRSVQKERGGKYNRKQTPKYTIKTAQQKPGVSPAAVALPTATSRCRHHARGAKPLPSPLPPRQATCPCQRAPPGCPHPDAHVRRHRSSCHCLQGTR